METSLELEKVFLKTLNVLRNVNLDSWVSVYVVELNSHKAIRLDIGKQKHYIYKNIHLWEYHHQYIRNSQPGDLYKVSADPNPVMLLREIVMNIITIRLKLIQDQELETPKNFKSRFGKFNEKKHKYVKEIDNELPIPF